MLSNIFSRSTRQDFENLLNNENIEPAHPTPPPSLCVLACHRGNL